MIGIALATVAALGCGWLEFVRWRRGRLIDLPPASGTPDGVGVGREPIGGFQLPPGPRAGGDDARATALAADVQASGDRDIAFARLNEGLADVEGELGGAPFRARAMLRICLLAGGLGAVLEVVSGPATSTLLAASAAMAAGAGGFAMTAGFGRLADVALGARRAWWDAVARRVVLSLGLSGADRAHAEAGSTVPRGIS